MDEKQKILNIKSEIGDAEQHTLNALNHLRDLKSIADYGMGIKERADLINQLGRIERNMTILCQVDTKKTTAVDKRDVVNIRDGLRTAIRHLGFKGKFKNEYQGRP